MCSAPLALLPHHSNSKDSALTSTTNEPKSHSGNATPVPLPKTLSPFPAHLSPPNSQPGRRRSVDVGGLALALGKDGLGHGWGGWEERENGEIRYAELLSDMYTHTQTTVNHQVLPPPLVITDEERFKLIDSLDDWTFEPHKLSEDGVLACTLLIFDTIYHIDGMEATIGVSLHRQLCPLLRHLREVYRKQNSYHNFQHALDVLQAMHAFLRVAGVVPPVSILRTPDVVWKRPDRGEGKVSLIDCLGNEDLFALYVAAVGHDVGHPGFTNMFMKNARAPLSLVYDDKSALEQMHCALLLQIMRAHGLGKFLDHHPLPHPPPPPPSTDINQNPSTDANQNPSTDPKEKSRSSDFRKLLLGTVLATDMGVHFDFMKRFKELVDAWESGELVVIESEQKLLLGQALLKCADISNPSRPHCVSEHWSAALMAEWTNQAMLERHLHLPSSTMASDDPVDEIKVQISFIKTFAKPLLDVIVAGIPEMDVFSKQCAANLEIWESRFAELTRPKVEDGTSPLSPTSSSFSSNSNYPPVPYRPVSPFQPDDFLTAFPLSLPTHFRSPTPTLTPFMEDQSMAWDSGSPEQSTSGVSFTSPFSETRGSVSRERTRQRQRTPTPPPPVSPTQSDTSSVRSRSISPPFAMPGAYPWNPISPAHARAPEPACVPPLSTPKTHPYHPHPPHHQCPHPPPPAQLTHPPPTTTNTALCCCGGS